MSSMRDPAPGPDPATLIGDVRQRVTADRRAFVEPDVKAWCARRWKFLFLSEAIRDPVALEAATQPADGRPLRQRIAERFLADGAAAAWRDEQPEHRDVRIGRTDLLVCPGLLNGLLPVREFRDDLPRLEQRFGLRALRSDSHPARGCEANVADIVRALQEGKGSDAAARPIPDGAARPPGEVIVVAYSKGAPDMLTTLIAHPEMGARVKCLFTWAGAIGGSQVADDLARKLKMLHFERQAAEIGMTLQVTAQSVMHGRLARRRRIAEFDTIGAIRDLTTPVRRAFLARHSATLDGLGIPMFTLRGVTRLNEVPVSQRGGYRLLSKFDAQNDMQVAGNCSMLPFAMATELAVLHGHHWDLAYPSFRQRKWLNNTYHPFPKLAALTAMVQLASELGLAA